jgi:hypothetical protein
MVVIFMLFQMLIIYNNDKDEFKFKFKRNFKKFYLHFLVVRFFLYLCDPVSSNSNNPLSRLVMCASFPSQTNEQIEDETNETCYHHPHPHHYQLHSHYHYHYHQYLILLYYYHYHYQILFLLNLE